MTGGYNQSYVKVQNFLKAKWKYGWMHFEIQMTDLLNDVPIAADLI